MDFQIHTECQKLINYIKANPTSTDTSSVPLHDVRNAHFERSQAYNGGSDCYFEGEREELTIPSEFSEDGIPVFIYKPSKCPKNPAILIYFHGGGFVLGTRHTVDPACKQISSSCGCIIVNVEYRLSPEHKVPAPMDDAQIVVDWVAKNKLSIGGTEQSPVGVGGDSAGGCIAASVAHDRPLQFQVLVYPTVLKRGDVSFPSMQKYKDGPIVTLKRQKWFADHYLPPGEEANPRVACILREKFYHLPPALVLIAEHDIFYDSGWLYAKKLQEHGVQVEVHEFKGATHSFFPSMAFCPTLCAEAYQRVSDFINKIQQS